MLQPGATIGRYLVKQKLAEGGMAEIFLATASGVEGFEKEVVIKVVHSFLANDRSFIDMFINEARLASRLNHGNVVQIFDFGKSDDRYYLAMEYVRGVSLFDVRRKCRTLGQPVPVIIAAEMCAQVARGMQYAHTLADKGDALGIVHRDVTPQNILLGFDGAVKLTDFGIAKAASTHTAPGMLKGKFAYMAPEQARGEEVDARTDIFALGIVLWELLTGGRLFSGDNDVALLRAVQTSVIAPPARLNPDVSEELSDIVMKALEREPERRHQSAYELERSLSNWVLKTATSADETSVALFTQNLFDQEFRSDRRQVSRPALAAVTPAKPSVANEHTLFVERQQHSATPAPASAVPAASPSAPTYIADKGEASSPDAAAPEGTPTGRPRTEQMPSLRNLPRVAGERTPSGPLGGGVVPRAEPVASRRPSGPLEPEAPDPKRTEPMPAMAPPRRAYSDAATKPANAAAALDRSRAPTESVSASVSASFVAQTEEPLTPPKSNRGLFVAFAGLVGLGIVGAVFLSSRTESTPAVEPIPVVQVNPTPLPDVPAPAIDPAPPPAVAVEATEPTPVDPPATPPPVVTKSAEPEVIADKEPRAPAAARQRSYGTLEINAQPWALVTVAQYKKYEVSGLRKLKIPSGKYDVRLEHPTKKMTQAVTIREGQTTSLTFFLDR